MTVERGRKLEVELALDAVLGTLRIVTRPSGEVRVDRPEDDSAPPDAAATPATLRLAPGRHAIEVRAPGHRPLRRLITVEARQEQSVEAALESLPKPTGSLALGGRELVAIALVIAASIGATRSSPPIDG